MELVRILFARNMTSKIKRFRKFWVLNNAQYGGRTIDVLKRFKFPVAMATYSLINVSVICYKDNVHRKQLSTLK